MSTSSASERETSEGSSSPISYTLRDSPYSSPSQQVPQLTNNLTELTCSDRIFPFNNNVCQPQLCLIEHAQNHFRFRYVSEMVGTHGCLLGATSGKTKSHPTVELLNYSGRALIRCRLAQCDSDEEHPHRLLEDDQDRDVSFYVPQHNSYRVSFAGMGIIHTAKKDVPSLLVKKYSERLKGQPYNIKELRTECENMAKKINLNIVRLRFSAHDVETGKEICDPVFSEPIHNMKSAATNDLKICRISQYSGRPRGGEDVFILVEKVNKKNIMVRFVELDDNGVVIWSENGVFLQSDVHHQYAIVFRTPPYRDPQTPVDVKVFIELARPSDGRTSDRKPFTYKAEQVYKQIKKRKNNSYSSLDSSTGGSITNEIPTVLFQNSNETADDNPPLFTIKPLSIPTGSPGHCGLGSALGTSINLPTINNGSPMHALHSPNSITSPNYVIDSPVMTMASPNDMINSPVSAMSSPNDIMIHSPNVMTSQTTPMWSATDVTTGPLTSSIPDFSLHSAELERIINQDVPPGEQRTLFIAEYFNLYTNSDMQTEEHNSSLGDIIRASTGLVADSGRPKVEPSSSNTSPTHSGDKSTSENKPKSQNDEGSDYDAFYKPEDGLEVKTLVQDLCEIIRNKKGYKNHEVKTKLARLFEIRLSNGDTFLHMTLRSSQPSFESIVKVISSVNMSHLLNLGNHKQLTILHLAVLYGNPKLVTLLVSKGCYPMLCNSEDDNVIQYAVRYGSKHLKPLLMAIQRYNPPCDLNACNSEKQTALHLAALADDATAVRLLAEHGASADARDAAGRTPLHLAAIDGKSQALKALAEIATDIDAVDGSGNTALQIVCGRTAPPSDETTLDLVDFLLKNKADPLKHEEHNESAWRLSRDNPSMRAVMKAFNNGADLEDDVKSEPEDEFESADEDMPETGLPELSHYIHLLSEKLDANGAWKELATRMRVEALSNWFAKQESPTSTMLTHVRECRENLTSKSLALMLEDMGQIDAANIVRACLDQ